MDKPAAIHREIAPGAAVTPPPEWADLAPYAIPAEPNPHFIAHGVCVLLDDSQIDLCGRDRAWYYRRAELVTAAAGAERAAQFNVHYDPAFERVEVHGISVIRGGQRIEHAETAFFEVLRRERNMERLQFDGRLTIHVTLPDVRQGDVVETSYTLYGTRKSLGGRHSVWIPFEWAVGIIETRLRQRAPRSRAIAERAVGDIPQAIETEVDGVVERRWRTTERPGVRYEALTPPWVMQSAHLQFSEWRDWGEVAAVFTPLYDDATAPLPDDVEAEIARIAQTCAAPADRAAAVLRFTQSAVRYLAISMGEGGYTPRPLADICATRYGDCKDKTKLYVHMARRLGLDACPALVNTRDGYAIDSWLPSATVFDHCIVRVCIGENVYWIDPTRQLQPSPLDKLSQCHFGWALPLRPDATALERMPDPPAPHLSETFEQVTLGGAPSAPVRYEWEHKFRDIRAEGVREHFARDGEVGVFKGYAEDIRRMWPNAQVVKQELVSDDVENNVVVVRECYELPDAWTKGEGAAYTFQTRDITIRGAFAPLDPGERRHPIYLGQPGRRTRRIDVRTETEHSGGWMRGHSAGDVLSWSDQMRVVTPTYLVVEQSLTIGAMSLPANDAEIYRSIEKDLQSNDLVITETAENGKFVGSRRQGGEMHPVVFWSVVAICGFAIAFIAMALQRPPG